MFTATEATAAEGLRQFGEALAAYLKEPVPFRHGIIRPSWGDLERPGRADDV
jgi:hypothetical protein